MLSARSWLNSASRTHVGIVLAVIAAVISGFAVFINGYGLRAWSGTADPTTYTTFKNMVAASEPVDLAGKPTDPEQAAWSFALKRKNFSDFISGAQRLPG